MMLSLGPLSDAWLRAFEELARDADFNAPVRAADGSTAAACACSMSSAGDVLARLPGHYVQGASAVEEMFDATGEAIDHESESTVWHCESERAIVACVDHWQAGLFVTVTVYPDGAAYVRGLAAASRTVSDDDDLSGEP